MNTPNITQTPGHPKFMSGDDLLTYLATHDKSAWVSIMRSQPLVTLSKAADICGYDVINVTSRAKLARMIIESF